METLLYVYNNKQYKVHPSREDEFLKGHPGAQLINSGGQVATATQEGGHFDVSNTDAGGQSASFVPPNALDMAISIPEPEISKEEKRKLPYYVNWGLSSSGKPFTRKNVDAAMASYESHKSRTLKEVLYSDKALKKFKDIGYNLFGPDGLGGVPGPMVLSRLAAVSATYSAALQQMYTMPSLPGMSPDLSGLVRHFNKYSDLQKETAKKYDDLITLQNYVKKMPAATDKHENLLDLMAGVTGSATEVGVSVVPAMIAGFGGTVIGGPTLGVIGAAAVSNTDILSQFVTDYNIEKAKRLHPGYSDGEAVGKLALEGGIEFWTPAAHATPAMAAEYIGLKGISKWLLAQKGAGAGFGRLLWAGNTEGATETFQMIPEAYNTAIAQGMSVPDSFKYAWTFAEENAFHTYMNAMVGTIAFSGTAKGVGKGLGKAWRGMKGARNAIDEGKMESIIGDIADLNQKRTETTDPLLKDALDEQIESKEEELRGLIINAASILNFASSEDFNSIADIETLKDSYLKKVQKLNKEKDNMAREDYIEALSIYKEKYLEAKDRIKGIVKDVADKSNETAQKVNKIWSEKKEDDKGEAINKIIELYRPLAKTIAGKRRNVPKGSQNFDLLVDEILTGKRGVLDLINTYEQYVKKQKKAGKKIAPLSGYINNLIKERAIEASKRILGEKFEGDITESKGAVATETAEDIINTKEKVKNNIKQKLGQVLELSNELQNKIVKSIEKALGTKLPSINKAKDFKFALKKVFRNDLVDSFKKLFGKQDAYEKFLRENWEKIWDAIPQETLNRKFGGLFTKKTTDKEGKQFREKTAEGKGVFTKPKITEQEFVDYFLNAKGSTKGVRKTSLAEVLADEVGLDDVLSTLTKDKKLLEKFKVLQEEGGEKLPSNFVEKIAEAIDRSIEYIDNLQKNNGVLYSSLVFPELTLAAVKTFLKAVKLGLKGGMGFAKALQSGIKEAQKLFDTKEEKAIVEKEFKKTYKKPSDLGNKSKTNTVVENLDKSLIGEKGKVLFDKEMKELKENPSDSNILDFFRYSLPTFLRGPGVNQLIKNKIGTSNASILKYLKKNIIPKEFHKNFSVEVKGGNSYLLYKGERIKSPLFRARLVPQSYNKTGANKKKFVKDLKNNIQKQHSQANEYKNFIIKKLIQFAKEGNISAAKAFLDIQGKFSDSALRMAGKIRSIEKGAELISYEHTPPIDFLIKKIKTVLDNYKSPRDTYNKINKILDSSSVDLISKKKKEKLDERKKTSMYPGYKIGDDSTGRYEGILDPKKDLEYFDTSHKDKEKINKEFNKIIERKSKGLLKWFDILSPVKARLMGKGKGIKFFIPYSAEDFVGLLYPLLGKGKIGDMDMKWFHENLIRPYSVAIQQYESARVHALNQWKALKDKLSSTMPGGLKKKNSTGFTNEHAVRVYIWVKQQMGGKKGLTDKLNLSKKDINDLLKIVNKNPKLKKFAEELMNLNPEGYPDPVSAWDIGNITTDLVAYVNETKRAEFLTQWKENVDTIFSEDNLTKLTALFGTPYVRAMRNILERMATGRNRRQNMTRPESAFLNWVNNSVGAIMFFNMRSAVLQTISSVNFLNWNDNNPMRAGLALANFPQFVKDFSTLFNSDFLKQRRAGLQNDINADEIANAAEGESNKVNAILSYLLKIGFAPTQIADSFAIASGGASFYRNRIKTYKKQGLSDIEAEKKAFLDFQEIAEETQQSARPDRISMQQAGSLGRLILAFQNTPMQMTRLMKKATLDLINGRGDWKANISKIAYYGAIQNIIFNSLQQALFTIIYDDDEEEKVKEKAKKKFASVLNRSLDGVLIGTGVYGAIVSTIKNVILKGIEDSKKKNPDYVDLLLKATSISPPINSKLNKLNSARKAFKYKQSREKIYTEGLSLENPGIAAGAGIIEAGTNIPVHRVVRKAEHLNEAFKKETEMWQAIALAMGWGKYELGFYDKKEEKGLRNQLKGGMKGNLKGRLK